MGQATRELNAIGAIERACQSTRALRSCLAFEVNACDSGIRMHLLPRKARIIAASMVDEGVLCERSVGGETRLCANALPRALR